MNPSNSDGAALIATERERQIAVEKYTADHDDRHTSHELVAAAFCYLARCHYRHNASVAMPPDWPWRKRDWKPRDRISDLVRAGALIAAEIDRLKRAP